MTTVDREELDAAEPTPPAGTAADGQPAARRFVLGIPAEPLRRTAVTVWAAVLLYSWIRHGVPIDHEALILWVVSGLLAGSLGRRPLHTVLIDWLPFAAVLIAYDLTRGAADALGRPTLWNEPVAVDKFIFGGVEPTVWLQSHLKQAFPPWWEVIVSCTYVSYFFAPFLIAGLLWMRNRNLWRRFVVRFVLVNLIGLSVFVLFPSAPPWAAAQCTRAEIAGGPSDPSCLNLPHGRDDGGLLGAFPVRVRDTSTPQPAPYIERVAVRGFDHLHLSIAQSLVAEGRLEANPVAAIPSLHAALSLLLSIFLWPILRRRWRPLLIAYPLVMAFSLVYGAEHYVFDILVGWALTTVVSVGAFAVERWWMRTRLAPAARVEAQLPARP